MSIDGARLALVTTDGAWETDEDAVPLVAALGRLGMHAEPAPWRDAGIDWAAFDLVVLRSPWDYTEHVEEFLTWADRVAACTTLANPVDVLRWNTDKHYLDELAASGLAVVPTHFVHPGEDPGATLSSVVAEGSRFVVKPTVSAGSRDTARYGADDLEAAGAHVDRLLADGRDVMVQPYVEAVDSAGETGMLFFDGVFSHAFRKGALLTRGAADVGRLYAVEQIGPRVPTAAELQLGAEALRLATARFGGDPFVYARVDVLPDADGAPMLLELELAEPSYFLSTDPGGADRAAAAYAGVLARLG